MDINDAKTGHVSVMGAQQAKEGRLPGLGHRDGSARHSHRGKPKEPRLASSGIAPANFFAEHTGEFIVVWLFSTSPDAVFCYADCVKPETRPCVFSF